MLHKIQIKKYKTLKQIAALSRSLVKVASCWLDLLFIAQSDDSLSANQRSTACLASDNATILFKNINTTLFSEALLRFTLKNMCIYNEIYPVEH